MDIYASPYVSLSNTPTEKPKSFLKMLLEKAELQDRIELIQQSSLQQLRQEPNYETHLKTLIGLRKLRDCDELIRNASFKEIHQALRDETNMNVLVWAVHSNNLEIIDAVVKRAAQLGYFLLPCCKNGLNIIEESIASKKEEIASYLIEKHQEYLRGFSPPASQALFLAVKTEQVKLVKQLLSVPDYVSVNKQIELPRDENVPEKEYVPRYKTALYCAIESKQHKTVRLLLKNGASLSVSCLGIPALGFALKTKERRVIQEVLKKIAPVAMAAMIMRNEKNLLDGYTQFLAGDINQCQEIPPNVDSIDYYQENIENILNKRLIFLNKTIQLEERVYKTLKILEISDRDQLCALKEELIQKEKEWKKEVEAAILSFTIQFAERQNREKVKLRAASFSELLSLTQKQQQVGLSSSNRLTLVAVELQLLFRDQKIQEILATKIEEENLYKKEIFFRESEEKVEFKKKVLSPVDQFAYFYLAALNHDEEIINQLIYSGFDLESTNHDGVTPFFLLMQNKQFEAARFLADKGASVEAVNQELHTIFNWAIIEEEKEIQREFLEIAKGKGDSDSALDSLIQVFDGNDAHFLALEADECYSACMECYDKIITPFIYAVMLGRYTFLKQLIEKVPNLLEKLPPEEKSDLLMWACKSDSCDLVKLLLEKGIPCEEEVILFVIETRSKRVFEAFLSSEQAEEELFDLIKKNSSILFELVRHNRKDLLPLILSRKGILSFNDYDEDGCSVLFMALSFGFKEIYEILSKAGAPLKVTKRGAFFEEFSNAIEKNDVWKVERLLTIASPSDDSHRSYINSCAASVIKNKQHLLLKAFLGYVKVATQLTVVDSGDRWTCTPLLFSMINGSKETTKVCLEAAVREHQSSGFLGAFSLLLAIHSKEHEKVRGLLEVDQELVESFNFDNVTPLLYAVYMEDEKSVEILLEKGANPDGTDLFKKIGKALDYALSKGHEGIILRLIGHALSDIEKVFIWAVNNKRLGLAKTCFEKAFALEKRDLLHARVPEQLLRAVANRDFPMVSLLIEKGFSADYSMDYVDLVSESDGLKIKSALEYVIKNGGKDILKLFMESDVTGRTKRKVFFEAHINKNKYLLDLFLSEFESDFYRLKDEYQDFYGSINS